MNKQAPGQIRFETGDLKIRLGNLVSLLWRHIHQFQAQAEKRITPHHPSARHLEHLGRDRVGDLIFDDLGRLFSVIRLDDDLDIGQVRDSIHRRG